jgi:hypothetical protein
MRVLSAVCVGVTLAFACAVFACGTDPVGVDACRRIETVRCESAPSCARPPDGGVGLDLSRPVHRGESDTSAVAACIRYYEDACLHGLEVSEDPGNVKTQACVDAIVNGSCDVVLTPEIHPDCAWLVPPAPPPAPAAPADAATD